MSNSFKGIPQSTIRKAFRKRNKYGAKGTRIDGIYFDSQKEAKYYGQLKMRKLAGDIRDFKVHQVFDFVVNGVHICQYEVDFVIWHNSGRYEYVDVKGVKTEVWTIKARLLKALHSIDVVCV